jgi:hypothetical protein
MSYSITRTETETFTLTHARHMAAKVATDLKRLQRFYGLPSDTKIAEYELEVTEFLKANYLDIVTYGFQRDGKWIEPTLRYTARDLQGASANDDDPGRVRPGANIVGANFKTYLTFNTLWDQASETERKAFRSRLPFQRGDAPQPGIQGYLCDDRTYSASGRALSRASVKS